MFYLKDHHGIHLGVNWNITKTLERSLWKNFPSLNYEHTLLLHVHKDHWVERIQSHMKRELPYHLDLEKMLAVARVIVPCSK